MRSRVSSLALGLPANARDTVEIVTPAMRAISAMRGRAGSPGCASGVADPPGVRPARFFGAVAVLAATDFLEESSELRGIKVVKVGGSTL